MDAGTPTETLTFLFTDIEGSVQKWDEEPRRMAEAVAAHDALLRAQVEAHNGRLIKTTGDGIYAAFVSPVDCIAAAIAIQQALADPSSTAGVPLLVRCGLHAGGAEQRDNDFFGGTINRAARIMGLAYGGQILASQSIAAIVNDALPSGNSLRYLGELRLRGMADVERVYQLVNPVLRSEFPALRALESSPTNLPPQLTTFIGRAKEIAEVKALLDHTRLLTLTGAGGCGKTRLALQVAADVLQSYPDGVWLIELARLTDPDLVPQQVAAALRLKGEPGRSLTQTLVAHLESRRLLLVLDNAEHLLAATASLVEILVRGCARLAILLTSRERLGVAGESSYRVPSLSTPQANRDTAPKQLARYESVQLFVERAHTHSPQFKVTPQNAPALASVCARLDGIPLALELAAARVRSLSVQEINQRLDQRFQLLTGGPRAVVPRQQTLRSLIEWSYDLLDDAERALFRRVALFAGGWTLEAAERICSGIGVEEESIIDRLTSLIDKSLMVVEERDGASRYGMLETVRQYARDRLLESGENAAWRERHLAYFLALAQEAEPHLVRSEQQVWFERLESEHENLRAALTWATKEAGDTTNGLRLAAALARFWRIRNYHREGRAALATALAAAPKAQNGDVRAKALVGAGTLAMDQGDEVAAALFEESMALCREAGDHRGIANALHGLGYLAGEKGDLGRSRALQEEAVALLREADDRASLGRALVNLGNTVLLSGDRPTGRGYHEEALAIARELGNRNDEGWTLANLAGSFHDEGNLSRSLACSTEALVIFRDLGDRRGVAGVLTVVMHLAMTMKRPVETIRAWSVAHRLITEIGWAVPANGRQICEEELARARAMVGEQVYERAWSEGQATTLDEAVQRVLDLSNASERRSRSRKRQL